MKKQKGITLIALIITIIVLLILAGVSISSIVGDNGIIKKSNDVKLESEIANEKEVLNIAIIEAAKKDKNGNIGVQALQKSIENQIGEDKVEISNLGDELGVVFKESGRQYIVDGDGNFRVPEWEKIDSGITNGEVTLQIGDYVNYKHTEGVNLEDSEKTTYISEKENTGYSESQIFNISSYSSESQGWRVLGIENGKVLLISADIIEPDSGGYVDETTGKTYYYLVGNEGYQNGIKELDKISSIYGNGKYAEKARSVTIDDINKITGYNPECIGVKNPTKEEIAVGIKANTEKEYEYGNKTTCFWNGTEYPYYTGTNGITGNLNSEHNVFYWFNESQNQWYKFLQSTTATTENMEEITVIENTYYRYYPETLIPNAYGDETIGIGKNTNEYDMLFQNTSSSKYFLADRQV